MFSHAFYTHVKAVYFFSMAHLLAASKKRVPRLESRCAAERDPSITQHPHLLSWVHRSLSHDCASFIAWQCTGNVESSRKWLFHNIWQNDDNNHYYRLNVWFFLSCMIIETIHAFIYIKYTQKTRGSRLSQYFFATFHKHR